MTTLPHPARHASGGAGDTLLFVLAARLRCAVASAICRASGSARLPD